MHTIQPNQPVRILTIQIAVPNEAEPDAFADELTWLLSENGTRSDNSNILDWHYLTEYQPQELVSFLLSSQFLNTIVPRVVPNTIYLFTIAGSIQNSLDQSIFWETAINFIF